MNDLWHGDQWTEDPLPVPPEYLVDVDTPAPRPRHRAPARPPKPTPVARLRGTPIRVYEWRSREHEH